MLEARCLTAAEIIAFECLEFTGTLYDLEVEATANYCVTEANISVHNSGKSAVMVAWLGEQAVKGKAGQNFWWIAPVAPVAAIMYRRMCAAIPFEYRTTHDTLQRVTLANGAHIWFKSAEKPDNLYGEDVYAAVIDEGSRVRESAFHALRSTLSATKGPIRIIGNVKGRRNWFYRGCRRAQSGEMADQKYCKLTWKDAVAGGILDASEIEDARSVLPPMVFAEMYEAEASDDQGNPFGITAIQECSLPHISTDPTVCWGVDLGKHQDWTVAVGLDRIGRVCEFHRWQLPWRETRIKLAGIISRVPALVDATGVGDPIVEELTRELPNVEGFVYTGPSKQRLMENLAITIQQRRVWFPEGIIRDELESFEYVYTRTGVKYDAPDGCHDDCVNALALACLHHKAGGHAGTFHFQRSDRLIERSRERGGGDRLLLI